MSDDEAPATYTAEEWQTIAAMRAMPAGPVYQAAAVALEYVVADRTGEVTCEVTLPDRMWDQIDERVRSGRFNTRGEVIERALRNLLADVGDQQPPQVKQEQPGGLLVVHPTRETMQFARDFLDRCPEGATVTMMLGDRSVALPETFTRVLRAAADILKFGGAVEVGSASDDE